MYFVHVLMFLRVVSYYDFSEHSIRVSGFPRNTFWIGHGRWVGGESSTKAFFGIF